MEKERKRVSYSDHEQNAVVSHYVSSTRDSVCEMDDSQEYLPEPFVFDPNDPKYLCLCGHAHSVTGVRLVACLMIITLLADAYQLLVTYYFSKKNLSTVFNNNGTNGTEIAKYFEEDDVFISVMTMCGGILVICCVSIALKFKKPSFLIPYLIVQLIGIVSVIFLAVIYGMMALWDRFAQNLQLRFRNVNVPVPKAENVLQIGVCVILLGLQVWLTLISLSCWKYLRDINLPHTRKNESAVNAVFKGLRQLSASAEDVRVKKSGAKSEQVRSVSVCLDKHPMMTV